MGAHDAETGDVPVLDAIRGLLLHLGEDVANDAGGLVGVFGGVAEVYCHVRELRP